MSDKHEEEESGDASFRRTMQETGYKPDADGVLFAAVKPRVLVAGAYKVIRTAAERAREALGRER